MVINRNITNTNRTTSANTAATWGAGKKRSIEWLVIHYTANGQSYKGMAKNNTRYFKTEYRGASAHYFVDDYEIWQCVEDYDSSWHCGDAPSKNGCYNWNSIGIEICDNGGEITAKAEALAIELVKYLMGKYNIKADHVCRHYDVTGKLCPASYAKSTAKWNAFKAKLNTADGSKGEIAGTDKQRFADELILYFKGKTTGTNPYGYECRVDKNGVVLENPAYKGNTEIPKGGKVISGHGKAATWLKNTVKSGNKVWVENGALKVSQKQYRSVDGVNVHRGTNMLCVYNKGANASTNQYGYEVAIGKDGKAIGNPVYGKGKMAIPTDGFVLSGHLASKTDSAGAWIYANIKKGTKVKFDGKVITIE